jgi:hypothetical protein
MSSKFDLSSADAAKHLFKQSTVAPPSKQAKATEAEAMAAAIEKLVQQSLAAHSISTEAAAAQAPPAQQPGVARPPQAAMQAKARMRMGADLARSRLQDGLRPEPGVPRQAGPSLDEVAKLLGTLERTLAGAPEASVAQAQLLGLAATVAQARAAGLSPRMGLKAALPPEQISRFEQALHSMLSGALPGSAEQQAQRLAAAVAEDARKILGELLAGVQGRTGLPPLGYPAEIFAPPAAPRQPAALPFLVASGAADGFPGSVSGAASALGPAPDQAHASARTQEERLSQARQLAQEGGIGPGPRTPETKAAGAASQDSATPAGASGAKSAATAAGKPPHRALPPLELAKDKAALEQASDEEKAKAIHAILNRSGPRLSPEERMAAVNILKSCKSKQEYDKVVQMAGGWDEVSKIVGRDEASGKTLRGLNDGWAAKEKAAAEKAVSLLEQARTPEEAKQIANELGGSQLKHQIKDPALLDRLNAAAKRHNLPALGYPVSGEQVAKYREQFQKAIRDKDSELATKLASDKNAMAVASPAEKGGLVNELMRGWNKNRHDEAAYNILKSCTSKAEFDEVLKLGGKRAYEDVGEEETKVKINELAGAFGRVDVANLPEVAKKFENVLVDPQRRAELGKTRPPTAEEAAGIGGPLKLDGLDPNDPLQQKFAHAAPLAKEHMAKQAFDLDSHPQAQNELVLENRRREIKGQPPLDLTGLTAQADKIMNEPDLDQKIRQWKKGKTKIGDPPDWAKDPSKPIPRDAKEDYLSERMESLAKEHGLSKQTMKHLVTERMGQVYEEAHGILMAHGGGAEIQKMREQLAKLEEAGQKDSPEAQALREKIAAFTKATGGYIDRVGETSEIYKSLFPMPPSFLEGFVNVLTAIARLLPDIAAAVCSFLPGIGPAIGGAIAAIKGVVSSAVSGDILGAFGSVLNVIPGVGQLASKSLDMARSAVAGDWKGLAGSALSFVPGAGGSIAKTAFQGAVAAGNVVEGAIKGDLSQIADGLSGAAGAAGGVLSKGSPASRAMDYLQKGSSLAGALASGDASRLLGAGADLLGQAGAATPLKELANNPIVRDVAKAAHKAAPFVEGLAGGDASKAMGAVADALGQVPGSPATKKALGMLQDGLRFGEALRSGEYGRALGGLAGSLQQLGASPAAADLVQGVGQMTSLVGALGKGDPQALAGALQGAGGFVQQIGGGALSRGLSGLSSLAGNVLASPELKSAMDLTGAGTRFLGGLANGDLNRALTGVAGLSGPLAKAVPGLSGLLNAAAPLVQSMARGDFQTALEALGKSQPGAGVAEKLGVLEPLAELANGRALQGLRSVEQGLGRLSQVQETLRYFEAIEEKTRELQSRYDRDWYEAARELSRRARLVRGPAPQEVAA